MQDLLSYLEQLALLVLFVHQVHRAKTIRFHQVGSQLVLASMLSVTQNWQCAQLVHSVLLVQ